VCRDVHHGADRILRGSGNPHGISRRGVR
jgi:hypothetical protein